MMKTALKYVFVITCLFFTTHSSAQTSDFDWNPKRYSLNDRFNLQKSKEMFIIIQSYYNPTNNVERAIRMWQGGAHYKVKSTQRYFEKVMSYMN